METSDSTHGPIRGPIASTMPITSLLMGDARRAEMEQIASNPYLPPDYVAALARFTMDREFDGDEVTFKGTEQEVKEVVIHSISVQLWDWYKQTKDFEVLRSHPQRGKLRVQLDDWDIVSESKPVDGMVKVHLRRKPPKEDRDGKGKH